MVILPRVMLEGSKVERNSKQSIVALVLPVELSWEEGRRDQGNTTLPSTSVSFLLQCLWNSCWWGDYTTTWVSVSVASYSRSQYLCRYNFLSADCSRHSSPTRVFSCYFTLQVKQPGNIVWLGILTAQRGDSKRPGPVLVKVQQTLWSQQGGSVYVLWPANFCFSVVIIPPIQAPLLMDGCEMKASFMVQNLQEKQHRAPTRVLFGCSSGASLGNGKFSCLWSEQGAFGEGQNIALEGNMKKESLHHNRTNSGKIWVYSHHQLDRSGITVKFTMSHPLKCVNMSKW